MRPFDLEQAKAGKPVCTRDGRDVRIVCWDFRNEKYPLVVIISEEDGDEDEIMTYSEKGEVIAGEFGCGYDLFMKNLPTTKREAYINIRRMEDGNYFSDGTIRFDRKSAESARRSFDEKVARIEWEEESC